jgi:uncharacterized delta-60 repeat protein
MALRRLVLSMLAVAAMGSLTADSAGAATISGSLDSSFANYSTVPVGAWAAAAATLVQPDGRIVTAGEASVNGKEVMLATRMNSNGQMDLTFGSRGIVTIPIGASAGVISGAGIALQSDGKILLAGTGQGNGSPNFAVVRLNRNGSLDATFSSDGIATVPIGGSAMATAIVVLSSGKLAVGGTAITGDGYHHFAVTRLNSNGSLDTSFGTGGVTVLAPTAAAWGMVLQPDGSLVLGGQQTYGGTQAYMAARVTSNGAIDTSFSGDGVATVPIGSNAVGDAIALQSDGKIVLTGDATTSTGVVATVRLNPNGSLDGSFGGGGIASYPGGGANALMIDGTGKLVIAGVGAAVLRLNPDGSLDTGFGGGNGYVIYQVGTASAANGIARQLSDGKLVIAGAATVGGENQLLVMRLMP